MPRRQPDRYVQTNYCEQPCGPVCRHVRGPLPRISLEPPGWLQAALAQLTATRRRSAPGADVGAVVACPVRERLIAGAYLRGPVINPAARPA